MCWNAINNNDYCAYIFFGLSSIYEVQRKDDKRIVEIKKISDKFKKLI